MWCEMQELRTTAPPGGGAQLDESASNSANSMAPCVIRQQHDGSGAASSAVIISCDDRFLKTFSGAARIAQIVSRRLFSLTDQLLEICL